MKLGPWLKYIVPKEMRSKSQFIEFDVYLVTIQKNFFAPKS